MPSVSIFIQANQQNNVNEGKTNFFRLEYVHKGVYTYS